LRTGTAARGKGCGAHFHIGIKRDFRERRKNCLERQYIEDHSRLEKRDSTSKDPLMLEVREFDQVLLSHPVTETGPVPSVCDPDGVYPYPSFVETSHRPILKRYRFLLLENDWLSVTVCPDLGGKVHSLVDKSSGKEALFVPASIHPVRILPRLGFIAGGIEVSFPISHTPVQLERVAYEARRVGDRAYVWCGERELHFGMEWGVEYSLGASDAYLTQRTYFRNGTSQAHPWMSWSNAAVPAFPDTEFHFPDGPVLYHGADVKTIDWAKEGPRRVGDLARMAGFFWLKPDAPAFGAYTPSRQTGLYHVADPASAPGAKLWSYGLGPHEIWARAGSVSGQSYLEIQGGPISNQSIKERLQPGQTHSHVEFWLPSSTPRDIRTMELPKPQLIEFRQIPPFDWPPRPQIQYWKAVLQAHAKRAPAELPLAPAVDENLWAPSGMEALGEALHWASTVTSREQSDGWSFQDGIWLAAIGRTDEALQVLATSNDERAHAVAGRLSFREKKDARAAVEAYRKIQTPVMAHHPQIVIERDRALAALGKPFLAEREHWLAQVASTFDEWLIERRAALLLDQGKPELAKALLERTAFQLVHQRYERTQLWDRVKKELRLEDGAPSNWLGEDDLATFGAYREFE
jgi:hypothetical protein